MGAIATFDYTAWSARYPEFSTTVTSGTAPLFFAEAGLYLNNAGCSPVQDIPTQTLIMYAITAHVAALNVGTNGAPASGLVGRISSASEGSVSVSVDLAVPKGAEWWGQTKYGFSAYQMLAPFRQFRYFVPGRCRW